MNNIPLAVGILILGAIVFCLVASVVRGLRSGSSWTQTSGSVRLFKVTNGMAFCTYQYEVDGKQFAGTKIMPGVSAKIKEGAVPKSV